MSGQQVLLVAARICQISYKNGYAGQLIQNLLPLLNLQVIVEIQPPKVFSRGNSFSRCSSELAELVPLPCSRGRFPRYSDRLHDFSNTVSRFHKNVYVNSFLPRTAILWNSLPRECFPVIYDLNGFKSRVDRHFLSLGSF